MDRLAQLTRAGLFDARVPRYTSYPTAPHFSAETGEAQFVAWVRAIPPGSRVSLYIHVPFCRRLCWFCACRTQGTVSDSPVVGYADDLRTELALLRAILPEGVTLSRLHWGGGTPTMLPPDCIRELSAAIRQAVPFGPDAEFSVEIDPNEIDAARLDALCEAGMTRASLGVQDFHPDIQKAIGRDQTYEVTRLAADMLRQRSITSLNADILFGLPRQTPERIADSVQKLLSLSPDRVALYGYAHVPWMSRRQVMIPSDSIPTPQERLRLFELAKELFLWDGYREIGIDHFARPGDGLERAAATGNLRRNFQGYTDDTAPVLIGLGASAISRFPQGYAQNAPVTAHYLRAVRSGHFATERGHAFRGEDTLRARMIEALMCDFRIDAAEMRDRFGVSAAQLAILFGRAREAFGEFVDVDEDGFSIPNFARPLARIIARSFDAYDMSRAGHSLAM
jgi:oxygen-independent coproporphyrinogen-3 oxidase